MTRYVDLTTLAANLCLTEAEALSWVEQRILPEPRTVGGKTLWIWSQVDAAMTGGTDHYRVYFVESQGHIKIGTTRNLEQRMAAFNHASPVPFTLLHDMEGSYDTEVDLHRRFSHLRTRGEWFLKGEDLLAYIDQMKNGKSISPRPEVYK